LWVLVWGSGWVQWDKEMHIQTKEQEMADGQKQFEFASES